MFWVDPELALPPGARCYGTARFFFAAVLFVLLRAITRFAYNPAVPKSQHCGSNHVMSVISWSRPGGTNKLKLYVYILR